jgi:hypothetical protein
LILSAKQTRIECEQSLVFLKDVIVAGLNEVFDDDSNLLLGERANPAFISMLLFPKWEVQGQWRRQAQQGVVGL